MLRCKCKSVNEMTMIALCYYINRFLRTIFIWTISRNHFYLGTTHHEPKVMPCRNIDVFFSDFCLFPSPYFLSGCTQLWRNKCLRMIMEILNSKPLYAPFCRREVSVSSEFDASFIKWPRLVLSSSYLPHHFSFENICSELIMS